MAASFFSRPAASHTMPRPAPPRDLEPDDVRPRGPAAAPAPRGFNYGRALLETLNRDLSDGLSDADVERLEQVKMQDGLHPEEIRALHAGAFCGAVQLIMSDYWLDEDKRAGWLLCIDVSGASVGRRENSVSADVVLMRPSLLCCSPSLPAAASRTNSRLPSGPSRTPRSSGSITPMDSTAVRSTRR